VPSAGVACNDRDQSENNEVVVKVSSLAARRAGAGRARCQYGTSCYQTGQAHLDKSRAAVLPHSAVFHIVNSYE
jgi:hypothetical protein